MRKDEKKNTERVTHPFFENIINHHLKSLRQSSKKNHFLQCLKK
jgi:hypothetical protein